jgi:hypothetical protein
MITVIIPELIADMSRWYASDLRTGSACGRQVQRDSARGFQRCSPTRYRPTGEKARFFADTNHKLLSGADSSSGVLMFVGMLNHLQTIREHVWRLH